MVTTRVSGLVVALFGYLIESKPTGLLLILLEHLVDLGTDLALGHADIVLHVAVRGHQAEEAVVRDIDLGFELALRLGGASCHRARAYQSVLVALDDRDVHVVGRGGQILELLAGEDVDGDKMDLGVTVLAGLGGGHVDNLARAVLDHDVTVLPQGRALHGEGGRGTGLATGLVLKSELLEIIESVAAL